MTKYLHTPEEVIDALQAGKTLTDGRTTWKMYNGWVVRRCNRNIWGVCDSITSCNDVYIEEQEPLKLEVGKFYKTRDGRKAWVVSQQKDERYPYIVAILGEGDCCYPMKSGRFFAKENSAFDLVAPWEEQ